MNSWTRCIYIHDNFINILIHKILLITNLYIADNLPNTPYSQHNLSMTSTDGINRLMAAASVSRYDVIDDLIALVTIRYGIIKN